MKTPRQERPGRGEKGKPGSGGRGGRSERRDANERGKPSRNRDRDTGAPRRGRAPEKQEPGRAPGSQSQGPQQQRREARRDRPKAPPPLLARQGRELLYGRNAVREALRGRRKLDRLFIAEGVREDNRLQPIVALARERGAAIDRVPRELLDDATHGANHQGIALEAETYAYAPFENLIETPGTVLVLDHVQDPQNLGTLLRAAEAAGVAGVVIPQNRAADVTPAVVNASSGAVEHLAISQVPNIARALQQLKQSGRWVAGLDAGPGAVDLFSADIPQPAVLVVGSEGTGLAPHVRKTCDLLFALPMRGRVESLNAATAGSIALYELVRRGDEGGREGDE